MKNARCTYVSSWGASCVKPHRHDGNHLVSFARHMPNPRHVVNMRRLPMATAARAVEQAQ